MGDKVNIESEFAFMCGKCFNVFHSIEETGTHVCVDRGQQKSQIFGKILFFFKHTYY